VNTNHRYRALAIAGPGLTAFAAGAFASDAATNLFAGPIVCVDETHAITSAIAVTDGEVPAAARMADFGKAYAGTDYPIASEPANIDAIVVLDTIEEGKTVYIDRQ
jgi:predicted amidohydrolase YtcJ